MPLRLYNTLTGHKEIFAPLHPGKAGIYVCGPTVYDHAHMGHARSAVFFDVLVRYLQCRGYETNFVRNFTDMDDKIIRRAGEEKCGIQSVAQRFMNAWHADMENLHVRKPAHEPKATAYIRPICDLIRILIAKGCAYESDGNVYFSVRSFPEYGRLSGRTLENIPAGYEGKNSPGKQHPADFALWKPADSSEPGWESPWGRGRPGWHMECSAMSREILGEQFDIHGGGADLIFPHHENEIAQSQSASGKIPAGYWIHHGMVTVNGRKMSKSLGNFLTIREVLTAFDPQPLRLFLLSAQYRNPLDFTFAKLAESSAALSRISASLTRMKKMIGSYHPHDFISGSYWKKFCAFMDDDVNTAAGISVLFQAVRELNTIMAEAEKSGLSADAKVTLQSGRADVLKIGKDILGIIWQGETQSQRMRQKPGMQKQSCKAAERMC
ncbi:MAG: cysteine--tRNA ligase [Desulfobacterales bacterium]